MLLPCELVNQNNFFFNLRASYVLLNVSDRDSGSHLIKLTEHAAHTNTHSAPQYIPTTYKTFHCYDNCWRK